MDRCGGAAARLPESGRKDLAIHALAGTETVSGLAAQHGVSRKFVYAQTGKARVALDGAFLAVTPENDVLFNLAVTKTWLHQVIVALPLICHSSYRGVIEFIRDLLGVSISVGAVHDALQSAARPEALPSGSLLGPPEAMRAAVAALPARLSSGDFGCAVVAPGGQDTLDPGVMAEVLATLTEVCLVLVAADDPRRARPAQGGDLGTGQLAVRERVRGVGLSKTK